MVREDRSVRPFWVGNAPKEHDRTDRRTIALRSESDDAVASDREGQQRLQIFRGQRCFAERAGEELYNTRRRYANLGMLAPAAYEETRQSELHENVRS